MNQKLYFYKKINENNSNGVLLHISSNVSLYGNKNINIINSKKIDILLKLQKEKSTDNLFIEYLNGLYVNKLKKYFPNVIYSIGLYEISDKTYKEYLKDNINLTKINKINDILNTHKYLNCDNTNNHYFFGVEYIDNTIPLSRWLNKFKLLKEENNIDDNEYDIFTIIYQLCFFIDAIGDTFVHNDLHLNNILLYEVNNRIKLSYHKPNGEIIILYVKYIPIIIDYGRAYCKELFNDITYINTLKAQKNLTNCGISITHNNTEQQKLYYFFSIMDYLYNIEVEINNDLHNMHKRPQIYLKNIIENIYNKYKNDFLKNASKCPPEYNDIAYLFYNNGFLETLYTKIKKTIDYNQTNFSYIHKKIKDNTYKFTTNDKIKSTKDLLDNLSILHLKLFNTIKFDTNENIDIYLNMTQKWKYSYNTN